MTGFNKNANYENYRCDPQKLEILVELRKSTNLSQQDVAEFFGMTNYGSVAAWEAGKSKPQTTRRERFMVYLLDKLFLRRNPELFQKVWLGVMVEEWGWPPLNDEEWQNIFPAQRRTTPGSLRPVQPSIDRLNIADVDLAQLVQVVVKLHVLVDRLLAAQTGLVSSIEDVSSGIKHYHN